MCSVGYLCTLDVPGYVPGYDQHRSKVGFIPDYIYPTKQLWGVFSKVYALDIPECLPDHDNNKVRYRIPQSIYVPC